jgi:hypothetical protein
VTSLEVSRCRAHAPLEEIFASAHRQLRPRTAVPEITIEFFPFAGLNHTARLRENRLKIRVSDIFTDAPAAVYHSLALILLSKLYRKKIDNAHHQAYRTFILEDHIQARARVARSGRGRQIRVRGSRGRFVELETLFDRLNAHYFAGSIPKPRLSWSAKRSRCILGRFDATHNTIFISRLFDSLDIPSYVCEYVLYHEMLHVKHQCQTRNSRLIAHTTEFRAEERQFLQYREAKLWLKQL